MNRKERLAALRRIAQTTGNTSTTTTSTSQQGTPQASTAPPAPSSAASILFPTVSVGWDASRVPYINRIIARLDAAVGLGTQGQYTFNKLWYAGFPSGVESDFTSPVKDVLFLLRRAFVNFLNSGINFQKPLNTGEIIQRINSLLNSPELSKLQQVNPASALGNTGISLLSIRQDLINMMPTANPR